jgi:hypothetical protein
MVAKKNTKSKKTPASPSDVAEKAQQTEQSDELKNSSANELSAEHKPADLTVTKKQQEQTTNHSEDVEVIGHSAVESQRIIQRTQILIAEGNNREARKLLVAMVETGAPLEQRDRAIELLGQIEVDVRTLLVGATAMITLLLIPVFGLVQSLWILPIIFTILLPTAPGVIAMLSFWSIPIGGSLASSVPLLGNFYVQVLIPLIGLIIAVILLITAYAPGLADRE